MKDCVFFALLGALLAAAVSAAHHYGLTMDWSCLWKFALAWFIAQPVGIWLWWLFWRGLSR